MGNSVSQGITSTQFFLYGRSRFTRTGWEKASKQYLEPTLLETINLKGRVFMVSGANSGIGFHVAHNLAARGGTVYMVCRNKERGETARQKIIEQTQNNNVQMIVADCGLRSEVLRVGEEFTKKETQLDALVCNAGALLNEKQVTSEGVEVTFATHLLFGTYLLNQVMTPSLEKSRDPRVVVVSSGGMYNTKFPKWELATGTSGSYDGQFAYSYAKRGQVLLCEEWSKVRSDIKYLSCHPGWTDTPGVDAAFGDSKKHLQPLRSLHEGAEGILWLSVVSGEQLESGEFYLDRSAQRKHLSGPFFTNGSFTTNEPSEVAEMMERLEQWANLNFD